MTKTFFWRTIFFLTLAGLWYSGWGVIAGILTIVYAFWYTSYELVVLAGMIDIHFMLGVFPWYTIGSTALFCFAEWSKPFIMAYKRS